MLTFSYNQSFLFYSETTKKKKSINTQLTLMHSIIIYNKYYFQMKNRKYYKYVTILQQAADLHGAAALLQWDQEVYMPPKSARFRARQLATLATQAHQLLTSEDYEHLLHELSGKELEERQSANIRLSLEDFEKNKKLSGDFVSRLSAASSNAYEAWIGARRQNDCSLFAPALEAIISLKKEEADRYGYEGHPYNALLDDYEKGATVAMMDPLFEDVKTKLRPLINAIARQPQVSSTIFHQHFPVPQQFAASKEILAAMGFDFEAGRQDYSEHPFTSSFSPEDVRVTTRADENDLANLLWSSIHEGGHGLYEQGLPPKQYGLPLGQAASLSIHESQSRIWENNVGRSRAFMTYLLQLLQSFFPKQLESATPQDLYLSANQVKPSLIRTEADELTYHFHVLIRYELEKALIAGDLPVKELPAAWNDHYEKYLGIRPANDLEGVLQDVHWSHGSFGYFPTYSLGSFYAAQLWQQFVKEDPQINEKMAAGNFESLTFWLQQHVFRFGRQYRSEVLCERITGKPLNLDGFMDYATEKYQDIYSFKL